MAITFHPKAGTVLMCDFSGFRAPEMIKTRPIVIVSPNHLRRAGLYTVVPLSCSAPDPIEAYHYKLKKDPLPYSNAESWAKCDMVATVCVDRLERIKVGRGHFKTSAISSEELEAIRNCLKYVLGIT
jgi:uncharacterized protein YifN (PemK superfamily)